MSSPRSNGSISNDNSIESKPSNNACFGVSISQLFFNFFALAKATSRVMITQQELDVVKKSTRQI